MDDVNPATIGFRSRHSRAEMFVCISTAAIVLFLELVLFGIGSGIAAAPEGFNKAVALGTVAEFPEGRLFFRGNDVFHVFFKPAFMVRFNLAPVLLLVRAAHWILLNLFGRSGGTGCVRLGLNRDCRGKQANEGGKEYPAGTGGCDHVSNLRWGSV